MARWTPETDDENARFAVLDDDLRATEERASFGKMLAVVVAAGTLIWAGAVWMLVQWGLA